MTYVKRGAQLLLVDDDKVPKYTDQGFEVFELKAKAAGSTPLELSEEERAALAAEKEQKKTAAAAKRAAAKSAGDPDAKDGE